jgi:precorrin-2 dehydrogenase / sirohydrochlorin ferrochelatase
MLPISVDLSQVRVMLVGEGEPACRRLALLDDAGAADLALYAPEPVPELARLAGARLRRRWPTAAETARVQLVFVVGVPEPVCGNIRRVATAAGVLINVEDDREQSSFHSAAVIRRGDLSIAISTGGKSPGLAALMRQVLDRRIGPQWEALLDELAVLRRAWRAAGADATVVARHTRDWVRHHRWRDPASEPSQRPPRPLG